MRYLLLLLIAVFPLGQLARWEPFGVETALHFNDLAVVLVGLIFWLRRPGELGRELKTSRITKPLIFWIGAMVLSLLVNLLNFEPRQILIASLYLGRFVAYANLFFIYRLEFQNSMLLRRSLWLAGVVVVLLGLLQYLFLPNLSFLARSNWDDHYYRLVSSFLDPGFTGLILFLALLLPFGSNWLKNSGRAKILAPVSVLLLYLGLLLTYSRASYLAYLVGFGLLALARRSAKLFIAAALVLLVSLPLLPKSSGEGTKLGREYSIWARIENWQQAITIFQKSPVFGVGFDTYRYAQKAAPTSHSGAGSDSSLLLVLATTGIMGITAYLFLLRAIWQEGSRDQIFLASFAAIIIHSWFANTLFYIFVMEWLWLLLAAAEKKPKESS